MRMRLVGALIAVVVSLAAPAWLEASHLGGTCLTATNLTTPCTATQGQTYSGIKLGTHTPDGNDTELAVEAVLGHVLGGGVLGSVDVTSAGDFDQSGNFGDFVISIVDKVLTWSYSGPLTLSFLTIKGGNGFAIFDIFGDTSGTVDVTTLLGHGISHVSFWTQQVAEPSVLLLAGLGLVGVAALARRWRGE